MAKSAVVKSAVTQEQVEAYLNENPEFALGYAVALVGTMSVSDFAAAVAGVACEEGEPEAEAEGEAEPEAEAEGEAEPEPEGEGAERSFPEQDAIKKMKESELKTAIKGTLGVEAAVANCREFVSICASIYESDELEFTRDQIKVVAKAFGHKVMTNDTVESLSEVISAKLQEIMGGDEAAPAEEEVSEEESDAEDIAAQLEAVKGATPAAKAAKTAPKATVKPAAKVVAKKK